MKRSYRALQWGVSLIFLSLLIAAVAWMGPAEILKVFYSLTAPVLWAIFLLMALNNLIRALRFRVALSDSRGPGIGDLWCVVNVHQFLNYILPARTGELSFVYLSHRFLDQTYGAGAGVLLMVRLLDLMLLALFFAGGLLRFATTSSHLPPSFLVMSFLLVLALSTGIVGFPVWVAMLSDWTRNWEANAGGRSKTIIRGITHFFGDMDRHFKENVSWKWRLELLLLSTAQYCVLFFIFWLVIWSSGTMVTVSQVVLGATGAIVGNMLPINALGSVGTLEAGWTLGFSLVGLDTRLAFTTSLVFHGLYLVFGGFLAGISWIVLQKRFSAVES